MDDVKIMVNKSSEWCFRESVKMKILSGFLYMKQSRLKYNGDNPQVRN